MTMLQAHERSPLITPARRRDVVKTSINKRENRPHSEKIARLP